MFSIDHDGIAGTRVVRVHGELDVATAPELVEALQRELAPTPPPDDLVIDLTGTEFMDSSGARVIVSYARQGRASGTKLRVVCPPANRKVRRVMELLQLDKALPVEDGLEETA